MKFNTLITFLQKSFLFFLFGFFFFSCANKSEEKEPTDRLPVVSPQALKTNLKMDSVTSTPKVKLDSTITIDYMMGKFEPSKNKNFTIIEIKYASRKGMYLRADVYTAFIKMYNAAKKDGINFTIKSATRNFDAQKRIWESKWTGQKTLSNGKNAAKTYANPKERALKILEYSSMPSTSRHHWGTDIDLNAFVNSYFEKGQGLKEYQWLSKHAASFGFCQPYTKKGTERPNGYNEEKWHWSYIPIAKKLSDQYKLRINDKMVKGFKGAEVAEEIRVVEKYVLGINKVCL